jgi:hypothetical protein
MKTRKGTWKIYIEHDYIPPSIISPLDANSYDRFCAIYFRGSKPYTIIRGNTANKNEIFDFLKKITRKVIEQIPFFSYPKKSLTEENGLSYGIRIGLIFSILIAVFVLFDYMLIPNYPEAFLQGANMSFGIDVNSHPLDSKILEYESITRLIIESIFPPKYRQLSSSMYTLAGIFILPILIFGFFYEKRNE